MQAEVLFPSGASLTGLRRRPSRATQRAGITASMPGVALKNGRKGEMVKVRNASSQRVISAMVAESGVVTTVSAE